MNTVRVFGPGNKLFLTGPMSLSIGKGEKTITRYSYSSTQLGTQPIASHYGKWWDSSETKIPYPPVLWFCDEFLDHLDKQLFSVRQWLRPDPLYPGWTYNHKWISAEEYRSSIFKTPDGKTFHPYTIVSVDHSDIDKATKVEIVDKNIIRYQPWDLGTDKNGKPYDIQKTEFWLWEINDSDDAEPNERNEIEARWPD